MDLNNPRGLADEVNKAALAEPSIAQSEVEARRNEVEGYGKGHGGWKDRIAVLVGLGTHAVFAGGFFWNLYGP